MHPRKDRKHRPRAILTEQQAAEIFRLRFVPSQHGVVTSAIAVGRRYGVNERTIRDIWKQRTWSHATQPPGESMRIQNKTHVGRPIGSKDSKPRKQKEWPFSTQYSRRLAKFHSPQSMCTQSMPISAFGQLLYPHLGFCTKLVDTSAAPCLRPEIVAPERNLASSPQESLADLPTDEGGSLEFESENGSIDAELHSWTLQHLPWIEGAELLLQ
jgi:hypothetical protein